MASSVVGPHGSAVTEPNTSSIRERSRLRGVPFIKMTGSGNDFVFFDGRNAPLGLLMEPETIKIICNRHNGIGADGIVILEPGCDGADVRIHYFNSDGTPADLCGNATLCATTLSVELGLAPASALRLATGVGLIQSHLNGLPTIELQPVDEVRVDMPITLVGTDERIGFAVVGIPHLVVLCPDAEAIDLVAVGPALRSHSASGPAGANVNWVSPLSGGTWRYRTFERGVEGETMACGTGAVATAVLLQAWGLLDTRHVTLRTSSGSDLQVTLKTSSDGRSLVPTLSGEGRIVYRGDIAAL